MRLCSIASGSSGNCIFVGSDEANILIDVGISKKRIEEGLNDIGVSPESIDAIFITHEHSDHIQGLGTWLRKYPCRIFSTIETLNAILHVKSLGRFDQDLFCDILPGDEVEIADMKVKAFSIPHDAANPVSYSVVSDGKKICVATDIGVFTPDIEKELLSCNAMLLEANHDVHMLEAGPYPYVLKRRILGDNGHLSNENSGKLLAKVWNEGLSNVFLGHLSKENNYPDLAYETVKEELQSVHPGCLEITKLSVAFRDRPSELVIV